MAYLATRLAAALTFLLLPASGHVTFKLPATPGVPAVALYPNTAPSGGYVPLDSAYLSNSPFMLNVPHAVSGLTTVGLQCLVPQPSLSSGTRITVTPAEVAGYNLQLGLTSQGMETSFTYSLNSANDPNFSTLGGWAQPAVDIANPASPSNDYKTNFFVFIGMSLPSPLGTFTDPNSTAIINGYPHVFFRCNEIAVNTTQLAQAAGNYANLQLYALLWTITPANVVSTCTTFGTANPSTGTVASPIGNVTLDFSFPYSPFGGRSAMVLEIASAPHIAFIPGNCMGAGCAYPFPGSVFNVSAPVTVSTWTSSPSCTGSSGSYTSVYQGTAVTTVVTSVPMPNPPPSPTVSKPFPVTIRGAVAWLVVLTVVFSLWLIISLASWAIKTVGAATEQAKDSTAPTEV